MARPWMIGGMKKTMMYLPEEMHAYLAGEAARRGVPMAEIAREAIAEYRTARDLATAPDVSALIGAIGDEGPPLEVAARADETLAEYFADDGDWQRENRA